MKITGELFEAFLKCPRKCWLRANGEPLGDNRYAEWVKTQNQSYCVSGIERLVKESSTGRVAASPAVENLKAAKWRLATRVTVSSEKNQNAVEACIHAVEAPCSGGKDKATKFIPIWFTFRNKIGRDVKLL